MFQNRAIEKVLGFDDIQKNLHTPSLLLSERILSLHEMTLQSNDELAKVDARIVKREDHIHLDNSY